MKTSTRNFIYLAVVIIVCVVVYLNQTLFLEGIVNPVTRVVWLGIRLFRVFDQKTVWTVLIFVAVIAGLAMIPVRPEGNFRSAYQDTDPVEDRVSFWRRLFSAAEVDREGRMALEKNLKKLNQTISDVLQDEGEVIIALTDSTNGFWQRVSGNGRRLIQRTIFKNSNGYKSEVIQDASHILQVMETRMENQDDQS